MLVVGEFSSLTAHSFGSTICKVTGKMRMANVENTQASWSFIIESHRLKLFFFFFFLTQSIHSVLH